MLKQRRLPRALQEHSKIQTTSISHLEAAVHEQTSERRLCGFGNIPLIARENMDSFGPSETRSVECDGCSQLTSIWVIHDLCFLSSLVCFQPVWLNLVSYNKPGISFKTEHLIHEWMLPKHFSFLIAGVQTHRLSVKPVQSFLCTNLYFLCVCVLSRVNKPQVTLFVGCNNNKQKKPPSLSHPHAVISPPPVLIV